MAEPLAKRTESVYSSLRVDGGDWLNLVGVIGYSFLLSAFLFLLSDYLLRRKSLI